MGKLTSPAYYTLARYRKMRRDWLGAVKQYRRLSQSHPKNVSLKRELAAVLFKAKQFSECLKVCNDLLSLQSPDRQIEILKLRVLQRIDANDEAIVFSKQLLKRNEDITIRLRLANYLAVAGKKKQSIVEYKNVIASNDESITAQQKKSEANYHLGWLMKDSDPSVANDHFARAIDLSTNQRTKTEGLGYLHAKAGHNDEAVAEYKVFLTEQPDNKQAWFQLAKTYMRLFDKESAAEAYKSAILIEHKESGFQLDEKKVVFDAFNGRAYACSPRAIYETMLADPKYKDFTFVWVLRSQSLSRYWRLYLSRRTKVVRYRSIDYFREYGSAKYWVANSRLLLLRKTDPRQVYLQTWHGTPFKKLGYSIESDTEGDSPNLSTPADEDTRRLDYFVSQSPTASDYFDEAFAFSKVGNRKAIIETGYPRNDNLTRATKQSATRIRSRLSIPKGKKVLLYAPTWRDDQYDKNRGYVFNLEADFDQMQKSLGDEWVILFRAHYLVAKGFNFAKYKDFIIDVSGIDDINNLYIASDALMTDYSSVFFDFAALNRPILFYMYDLEHYRDKLRGFYLELDELPGKIVKTTDEVIAAVKDMKSGTLAENYQTFKQKFAPLDDGHATERVIDQVFQKGN